MLCNPHDISCLPNLKTAISRKKKYENQITVSSTVEQDKNKYYVK